jgi:hypothetical protein
MIGPGLPDLNRLYLQATWDPGTGRWTKPPANDLLTGNATEGKETP